MMVSEGPDPLFARTGWRLAASFIFSNLDGAVFTYVFLSFVVPNAGGADSSDLLTFVGYMVFAIPLGSYLGSRTTERALCWLQEERPPTDEERRATLRLPFHLALQSASFWVVAALGFAIKELFEGGGFVAMRILFVTIDGGLVCATVGFLLAERALRPVFARALAGRAATGDCPTRLGVRPRLVLTWLLGSGIPLFGLATLPVANQIVESPNLTGAVLVLSIAGLFVGAFVMIVAAKSVAEPLSELRDALERVGKGNLDVEVSVDDGGEIGQLQAGVNAMVAGLRERERLADLFGKHVGQEVAELALAQGTGLESELREASALFVDLVGSTAMAEVLPPDAVVQTLNAYFGTVVRVAASEGGWVNKFEGDGALCVFGTPATQPDHAARALRAARKLHDELARLQREYPGLDAAIGVSSGQVVAGNVGTESRYEYTVIGRPVNEAARLTELAKGRASRVVAASGAVERSGTEARHWASLGTVAIRGQQAPTEIHEPAELVATRA